MTRIPLPWLFAALLAWMLPGQALAQDLTVNVAVSSDAVSVGEPFQYQLQISGSDSPEPPDLSGITGFVVTPQGSGTNSSSSMTIINGRVTKDVRKGFLFTYQLVPQKEGTFTIPPITVREGNRTATTQPVQITVGQAQESDDFKLRISLSKSDAWVGETLTMDLTFYFKENLEQPQLNLPVASDPQFTVHEVELQGQNETAYFEGQQYQVMRARRMLIPKQPGTFHLEPASLTFRGVAGYRVQQDLFFGRQQVPHYRHFVVPSNALDLTVRDLPAQGKPPGFAGHVGSYRISASATPLKVNVGDPITLNITISGPEFLKGIDLPPLQRQAELAKNFRLPTDRSTGQVQNNSVLFSQVIRAARPEVSRIPAIELPYFDPAAGAYRIARSEPISLDVSETRVVTARDAEGTEPVAPATAEVEAWTRGIAHNYEDEDALRSQRFSAAAWFGSGSFWSLLLLPSAAYAALWFVVRRSRASQADPGGARQAQAARTFQTRIATASSSDEVLEVLRGYLGDRLRLAAGALTSKDLREPLRRSGVPEETIAAAEDIFRRCETSRYSGTTSEDATALANASRQVVETIEARLQPAGLPWLNLDQLRRLPGVSRFFPLLVLTASLAATLTGTAPAQDAQGEGDASPQELFQEANALFRQANELSAKDPAAARETYAKSILRFERLIRQGGIENGKLYYNMGNAHFRTRDIGRAIVNYRRAQDLMPHDANVAQNLEFARSRRMDRIETPAQRRLAEILFFWHYDLPSGIKAALFAWIVVAAWGAAAVRLFLPRPWLLWFAGSGGTIALLLLLSLSLDAKAASQAGEAVIVSEEIVARKGDSETYEPSFKEPLHAGTELRIREERAGWIQAELGDGRTCWLPEKAVERIWD